MPESKTWLAIRIAADDHERTCLAEALVYNIEPGREKLIGRALADQIAGRTADSEQPEAIWQTLFGNQAIGFSFTIAGEHVVISSDDGLANPLLIGRLMQIVFPNRLPLSFTYASERPGERDVFSGGWVIVTDTSVGQFDARDFAERARSIEGPR